MSSDESMGWEWFWNGRGMLALKQNQTSFEGRAEDKEPCLYFEAHEVAKLIEDLRRAAADGVEMVEGEMRQQVKVVEALRGVSLEEVAVLPVAEVERKKKGRAHERSC
jgi:hypothetical protein